MIIFRYLLREILYVMLAVLVIFVLIFLSTQLALYLQKMANGELAVNVLLRLTATFIPLLTGLLLPMAFFLAIMLAYGRLYAESEMTVLHACGYGRMRLLKDTVLLSLGVVLLVSWLVMEVTPNVLRYQKALLAETAANNLLQTLVPGQFKTAPDGKRIFYIENVSRDRKNLEGIFTVTQAPDSTLLSSQQDSNTQPSGNQQKHDVDWDIVYAKRAYQQDEPERGGTYVVARDGYRYVGQAGQHRFQISHYGTYAVRVPAASINTANISSIESQSMQQLWQNYQLPAAASEFQWRISAALQTFILCLLAVSLSRVRPRQGRYEPLFPAIVIYTVYGTLLYSARDWVSNGIIPSSLGLWWIHALLLLLALYLAFDKPGWTRLMNALFHRNVK